METSQRPEVTQQILADPGRELTSVGKCLFFFFFKIVVSSDVQFWMSPEGPAISSIQDGEPGGPNSW